MTRWMLLLFLSGSTLLRNTFEDGSEGWIAAGRGGSLRVTHDSSDVRTGSGALAFDYTVGAGIAIAVLPLREIDTSHLDSLRFWVKTDVPTGLAVVINEKKPGGAYRAVSWSTGNGWQQVELTPADFHLNDGPNDAPDPDGKLDLDSIANIGVLDLNSVVGARAEPNAPFVTESHAGKHTLFLDDFELWSGDAQAIRDRSFLDGFSTPQLQWFTRGGAELKPENRGMRVTYQQSEDKGILLTRMLSGVDLRGKEKLAFDIASDEPVDFVMALECEAPGKQQGPRYNANIEAVGGGKAHHREVLLSAFGDGQGELPPIQLDRLKSLTILEITGQTTPGTRRNSLWIGNIRGVGETKDQ